MELKAADRARMIRKVKTGMIKNFIRIRFKPFMPARHLIHATIRLIKLRNTEYNGI